MNIHGETVPTRVIRGELIPVVHRPPLTIPEVKRAVDDANHFFNARGHGLLDIPIDAWNNLMDALGMCECGRQLSPSTVLKKSADRVNHCSWVCYQHAANRRMKKRMKERVRVSESLQRSEYDI